ncbi:efflux RND transporter periplasmic adaptor subunit [Maribacter algicola]|uniref:Efflux RND transporter periplasmic adaptor subunit n=1 Tax=Meishania litoralis TaxID=3434685 RepID=A0ACC7LHB1_9FLAO
MKKYNNIPLVLLLAIMLTSCGEVEKKNAQILSENSAESFDGIQLTREQFEKNGMALGTLEEKSFPVSIRTNGMIDVPPENKAVVSAKMGGYISKTPLLIGDVVKKGQVLVTIENPEFVTLQQEYMEIKQQMAYLKSEYDRQKTLMDENITSQKSFLKSESEYKTANAKYNGLRKQLTMLNISPSEVEKGNITSIATVYAPINGSITKVNVTKGTYVSPASPILEIIDNGHIHLELSVFEKDIMKVKKGQDIRFRIPEASPEIFEAEVHLIGTSIEENRTIKVHGHLKDESKNNFLTGMFVEAEIAVDNITAMALPSEAIVAVDNINYVLVLEKEENNMLYFKQLEVELGNNFGNFTVIENIRQRSDQTKFLTKGAFDLLGE